MHIAIEGPDCVGKSSIIDDLSDRLAVGFDNKVVVARHPGSTPLGTALRNLVLFPTRTLGIETEVEPISQQLMMIADYMQFYREYKDYLEKNIVLSDRHTYISSMVYGAASGIAMDSLRSIWSGLNYPKADFLIMLTADRDVLSQRLAAKNNRDVFEQSEFQSRVIDGYHAMTSDKADWQNMHSIAKSILVVDTSTSNVQSAVDEIYEYVVKVHQMILNH